MSAGMVRKWVQAFKDGLTNVQKWCRKLTTTIRKNRRFKITSLYDDFLAFETLALRKRITGQTSHAAGLSIGGGILNVC